MIEIKWETGKMDIQPEGFLNPPCAVGVFRKLIKLAAESDVGYETRAVHQWQAEVNDRIRQVKEAAAVEVESVEHCINQLHKSYDRIGVPYEKKKKDLERMEAEIAALKNAVTESLKKLSARKKKLERFKEILETVKEDRDR